MIGIKPPDLHTRHPKCGMTLPLADVMPHVSKLNASSAGLDGLSGPELNFSVSMMHALTDFYVFMESAACCPKKWVQICQAHIPKPMIRPLMLANKCCQHFLAPLGVSQFETHRHTQAHTVTIDWINAWCSNSMHAGKQNLVLLFMVYLMLLKQSLYLITALPSTERSPLWLFMHSNG